MQKPMTPTLPVQSASAASQSRTASMSSKVRPRPAPRSRMMVRRQRNRVPQWYRSGATARYPALASQSAWLRRSWLIPVKSWITTTPGQGPTAAGVATYVGISPRGVEIFTSATVPARSPIARGGAAASWRPEPATHPMRRWSPLAEGRHIMTVVSRCGSHRCSGLSRSARCLMPSRSLRIIGKSPNSNRIRVSRASPGDAAPAILLLQPRDQARAAAVDRGELPRPGAVRLRPQQPLVGLERLDPERGRLVDLAGHRHPVAHLGSPGTRGRMRSALGRAALSNRS